MPMTDIQMDARTGPAGRFASEKQAAAMRPTAETYNPLQEAYDTLNRALFSSALPRCLITLQRRKKSYGYFAGGRFGRRDGAVTDEIALNPSHFAERTVEAVLATLAHEMVHLWQHHCGAPGRGRYHNRQWAEQMKAIGLQPTDTGEEGGKETGERVSHFVIPDGPFARAAAKLAARGFALPWTERPKASLSRAGGEDEAGGEPESKSGKRVKYTCPRCGLNAWAKHEAALICGADDAPMASAP